MTSRSNAVEADQQQKNTVAEQKMHLAGTGFVSTLSFSCGEEAWRAPFCSGRYCFAYLSPDSVL